ncbi:UNVERIFIED_CONTAM: hypothetical protein Scaly_2839900 [Sesamum calycinum]|uniref:CCHC-type domain-containing protein n=1 Tax=Sesamum calycinum TaxID=2727403 RepID=A0AAW2IRR7_9LAMI
MLAAMTEDENPADVDLSWCEFHVRIHGLPLGKMTTDIAKFIGGKVGRLMEYAQPQGPTVWGSFMRLRVAIDNFCYLCGKLGHISKWCYSRFQADFVDPGENSPFGPWLRAVGRTDSRTRFPQNRDFQAHSQSVRPRFSSRILASSLPVSEPKRGSAIFGDFATTATSSTAAPALRPEPSPSVKTIPVD